MVFTTDFSCLGVTTPNRFLDVLTFGDDMANGTKRAYGTFTRCEAEKEPLSRASARVSAICYIMVLTFGFNISFAPKSTKSFFLGNNAKMSDFVTD